MKIIFTNGEELIAYTAEGGRRFIQGAERDCITFVIPVDAGINNVDKVFTEANCESITIVDEEGNEYIHKGYTIRVELMKKPVVIASSTVDEDDVYEDRLLVSMAQRTYSESQVKLMSDEITNTQLALCEVYELMT